ncbi:hypothetical protein TNCV_3229651 [Trichonephila clavipes]|nr:hypothetical protein TNCV_3229651 [Trichonephila clavipes]
MFRSSDQSDAKPPVLSSQASLVLIYRLTEGMSRPFPAQDLNPGPMNIAIRIHFHHCVNENMLPEPRTFHWVVPECKLTVIV